MDPSQSLLNEPVVLVSLTDDNDDPASSLWPATLYPDYRDVLVRLANDPLQGHLRSRIFLESMTARPGYEAVAVLFGRRDPQTIPLFGDDLSRRTEDYYVRYGDVLASGPSDELREAMRAAMARIRMSVEKEVEAPPKPVTETDVVLAAPASSRKGQAGERISSTALVEVDGRTSEVAKASSAASAKKKAAPAAKKTTTTKSKSAKRGRSTAARPALKSVPENEEMPSREEEYDAEDEKESSHKRGRRNTRVRLDMDNEGSEDKEIVNDDDAEDAGSKSVASLASDVTPVAVRDTYVQAWSKLQALGYTWKFCPKHERVYFAPGRTSTKDGVAGKDYFEGLKAFKMYVQEAYDWRGETISPVELTGPRRRKSSERATDNKATSDVTPVALRDTYVNAWKKLQALGYTWKFCPKHERVYFPPGRTSTKDGIAGKDFFEGLKAFKMYVQEAYGWRGETISPMELTGPRRRKSSDRAAENEERRKKEEQRRDKEKEKSAASAKKKFEAAEKRKANAAAKKKSAEAAEKRKADAAAKKKAAAAGRGVKRSRSPVAKRSRSPSKRVRPAKASSPDPSIRRCLPIGTPSPKGGRAGSLVEDFEERSLYSVSGSSLSSHQNQEEILVHDDDTTPARSVSSSFSVVSVDTFSDVWRVLSRLDFRQQQGNYLVPKTKETFDDEEDLRRYLAVNRIQVTPTKRNKLSDLDKATLARWIAKTHLPPHVKVYPDAISNLNAFHRLKKRGFSHRHGNGLRVQDYYLTPGAEMLPTEEEMLSTKNVTWCEDLHGLREWCARHGVPGEEWDEDRVVLAFWASQCAEWLNVFAEDDAEIPGADDGPAGRPSRSKRASTGSTKTASGKPPKAPTARQYPKRLRSPPSTTVVTDQASATTRSHKTVESVEPEVVLKFQDAWMILSTYLGFRFRQGRYFLPGVSDADASENVNCFTSTVALQRHLCEHGVPGDRSRLTGDDDDIVHDLSRWLKYTHVPVNVGAMEPLADKDAWKLLVKRGFSCPNGRYTLPGHELKIVNNSSWFRFVNVTFFEKLFGLQEWCCRRGVPRLGNADDGRLALWASCSKHDIFQDPSLAATNGSGGRSTRRKSGTPATTPRTPVESGAKKPPPRKTSRTPTDDTTPRKKGANRNHQSGKTTPRGGGLGSSPKMTPVADGSTPLRRSSRLTPDSTTRSNASRPKDLFAAAESSMRGLMAATKSAKKSPLASTPTEHAVDEEPSPCENQDVAETRTDRPQDAPTPKVSMDPEDVVKDHDDDDANDDDEAHFTTATQPSSSVMSQELDAEADVARESHAEEGLKAIGETAEEEEEEESDDDNDKYAHIPRREFLEDCIFALSQRHDIVENDDGVWRQQVNETRAFVEAAVQAFGHTGSSSESERVLHLSGAPGTGKTSATRRVANICAAWARENAYAILGDRDPEAWDPVPLFVHTNAAQEWSSDGGGFTSTVIMELANALDLQDNGAGLVDTIEKRLSVSSHAFKKKKRALVLVVDEVDMLIGNTGSNNTALLDKLFQWSVSDRIMLTVVCISNVVDLRWPIQLADYTNRDTMRKIVFPPYKMEDLRGIVANRIGPHVFVDKALTFAARKIEASSGDARKMLELCTKAIEARIDNLTEQEMYEILPSEDRRNMVGLPSVMKVVRAMQECKYLDLIQGLPETAKVVLLVAVMLAHTLGRCEISVGKLKRVCIEACRHGIMDTLSMDCFHDVLDLLCNAALFRIDVDEWSNDMYDRKLRLGVQLLDVECALEESLADTPIYRKMIEDVRNIATRMQHEFS